MKINKRTIRAEEEAIRNEVAALESQKQKEFHTYCAEKLKDPDTFAALTWSLPIGLHHFYLGAWQRALLDIGFVVAGLILMITGTLGESSFFVALIGVLIVCLVSIAELNSLFRSQLIVSHYNNQLMRRALQKLTDQGSLDNNY